MSDSYLGTAIVHLEPLLEQLHSRNEPVEKKYQVISQAEVVANLDRMEVKPDMLEAGALGIRFGTWAKQKSFLERLIIALCRMRISPSVENVGICIDEQLSPQDPRINLRGLDASGACYWCSLYFIHAA